MKWKDYDPEWLALLAEEQAPEESWLPDALRKCTRYAAESRAYYHFVSSERGEQGLAGWKFERNIFLHHKKEGELVLDILEGKRVGGVEFLKRL